MFDAIEYTHPSSSTTRHDENSLQLRLQAVVATCAEWGNQDNRQKALFIIVAVIGVAGVAALFSTAFSTCSKISLENKTSESIVIYGAGPLKTKVSSSLLLPHTKTTITLNGYNSYANLYTNAGEMHFSDFGKRGTLKDGASNKGIEPGEPPIVFWVCNQNYVKVTSPSNVTSSVDFLVGSTSYIQGLADLFASPSKNSYLRGSSVTDTEIAKISPVFSFRKSTFSFYKADEAENVSRQDKANQLQLHA